MNILVFTTINNYIGINKYNTTMTKRKGGIGRHYGRKRSSNNKMTLEKSKDNSLQQDIAAHLAEKEKMKLQEKKKVLPKERMIVNLKAENQLLKVHASNIMKVKRSSDLKVASLLKKGAEIFFGLQE